MMSKKEENVHSPLLITELSVGRYDQVKKSLRPETMTILLVALF